MKIKKIELTIENSRFVIRESHPCSKTPGLCIYDDHGDYTATLPKGATEGECWIVAHDMFRNATGNVGTSGDARALQMILSLSLP
jgi:hypothetical protein